MGGDSLSLYPCTVHMHVLYICEGDPEVILFGSITEQMTNESTAGTDASVKEDMKLLDLASLARLASQHFC